MSPSLSRFSLATLLFTVGVVGFGAVVRATGSGSGCGTDWPTCGEPLSGDVATVIEFTHRATSGIALVLVVALAVWARRSAPRGSLLRGAALVSAVLIVVEALIGLALVRFEWVADDRSIARVVAVSLHLLNTFLLIGALTVTVWAARGREASMRAMLRLPLVRWGGGALLVVALLGAVTALGDTLFPAESLGAGIRDDLSGALLVRLRWVHPLVAILAAVGLMQALGSRTDDSSMARPVAYGLGLQLGLGVLNVVLLAPLWMQVVHLLVADAIWIGFIVVGLDLARTDRLSAAPA